MAGYDLELLGDRGVKGRAAHRRCFWGMERFKKASNGVLPQGLLGITPEKPPAVCGQIPKSHTACRHGKMRLRRENFRELHGYDIVTTHSVITGMKDVSGKFSSLIEFIRGNTVRLSLRSGQWRNRRPAAGKRAEDPNWRILRTS